MKPRIGLCLLLLLVAGPYEKAGEPTATDEAAARLEAMGWLAGHWRGPSSGGTWEAIYSGPDGGLILSLNKQVIDGRLRTFEIEQFRVQDGQLVMAPSPLGQPSPVVFTLTEWDAAARRAVFTNPEHDFPQILTYHRVAEDRLQVSAYADRDGRRVGFELDLKLQGE